MAHAADPTAPTVDDRAAATASTASGAAAAGEPAALAPGTLIDRYQIEGRLGAGAMGVVHAALDPELDRRVAIKLLRRGRDDDALRARLLREGQALAKIDHTNVVEVYDVGTHDGTVFVAMELVRGTTLRAWLTERRTWREVVAVLAAAGRGLAAAHAAGLVHRDVKPDNILVGDDGVTRVGDFGLARAAGGVGDDPVAVPTGSLGSELTATGSLLGTPVYAPPEQLAGGDVGPLADQFAFCVTAYEAVYGRRPFAATTVAGLIEAIERGTIEPAPAGRRIPARIHRAIVRGLAAKPDQRWPAMDDLVRELVPPPRRWPWIAAAGATIAIAAVVVAIALSGRAAPARCRSADDRLAGVWDAAQRGKVTAAFAALPGYAATGPRVIGELDRFGDGWRRGWRDACTAGAQASTTFDLRVACLERRRDELAAVAGVMVAADRGTASAVPAVLATLGSIASCADAAALAALPLPPPPLRAAVAEIDGALAAGLALIAVRKVRDARAVVEPAVTKAEATAYAPIVGKAQLVLSDLEREAGRLAEAEAAARAASKAALAANDRDLIASALISLSGIRSMQGDTDGASESLDLAAGTITAMGTAASRKVRYLYADAMANLRSNQQRIPESLPYVDQAIAIAEEPPVDKLRLAIELTQRGNVMLAVSRPADARAPLERALGLMTEVMGPGHPNVAVIRGLLGLVLVGERKFADAIETIRDAHRVLVETLGPDDGSTLDLETPMGGVAVELGDYATAIGHFEHIVTAVSKMDPRANQVIMARLTLGEIQRRSGQPSRALELLTALRADVDAALGASSVYAMYIDMFVAFALRDLGRFAEAAPRFDRVEEVLRTNFGTEIEEYGQVRYGRGSTRLGQGKLAAALADLKVARAVYDRIPAPYFQCRTELALAEVLWRSGDHAGGQAAAAKARTVLDELSPTANAPLRDEITAWQRVHP